MYGCVGFSSSSGQRLTYKRLGAVPAIHHFTVVYLVAWPLYEYEAGVDFISMRTASST